IRSLSHNGFGSAWSIAPSIEPRPHAGALALQGDRSADRTGNLSPLPINQQPTTNNQQPTTNNQQPSTNNQQLEEYRGLICRNPVRPSTDLRPLRETAERLSVPTASAAGPPVVAT